METMRNSCATPVKNRWILGAGGSHGPGHLGVWKRAKELNVSVDEDEVLGVSVGAVIATFLTNGYTPEQIEPIFIEMIRSRKNPANLWKAFNPWDPIAFSIGGPFRLLPYMRELVAKYNLKPNKRLRILACDQRQEPVIFEGENYDLALAMAASGSVPGAFQPVWYFNGGMPRLLVDGALYHYNPTEFSSEPCIVSKFRPATGLPTEFETPWDLYFHLREVFFPLAGNSRYVDASKHIVIENGLPNVAGLNLGISDETIREMIQSGYDAAGPILEQGIAEGRIVVNK